MHSFLLIGQSNMAGRGYLQDAIAVDTDRIYVLRNGRWQPMFRPINPDRSFSGVSLAENFASCYAQTYDADVGLICCADGGTSLSQWMPGSVLYDNAIMHAQLAKRTSTIAGILWHQGESDCADGRYYAYKDNLLRMLQSLRNDLNLPHVPILLGGLGEYLIDCPRPAWELHNYQHINHALQDIARELPITGFVPADGLQSNPDFLHFNAASLHEFGKRYFLQYQKMMGNRILADCKCNDSENCCSEMEKL